jgi:hypothetical protein
VIPAERFVVEFRWYEDWLEARTHGVTATAVARAATPSGFAAEVASWDEPAFEGNEYTDFGTWAERYLLEHAHRTEGILPSDWLIRGEIPWHMGTPDGLSLDHQTIAEAKTGVTLPQSVKREHRDQCQWNMHVTGATRCLYLFQPRVAGPNGYYMGLIEPWTRWVERDDTRIEELIGVAERLQEAKEAHRGELQLG